MWGGSSRALARVLVSKNPSRSPTVTVTTKSIAIRFASSKKQPPAPPPPPPSQQPSSSPSSSSGATTATSSSNQSYRPVVLTGAVVLIALVGAYTGAQLKSDYDRAGRARQFKALSIDDQVAMLEERRAALVAAQAPLDKSLARLRARMAAEKKKEEEDENEGSS